MASASGGYQSRPPFGRAGTKPLPGARPKPRPPQPAPQSVEAAGPFGIGRVFRRAMGVVGPNAVTLFALIALAAMPERVLYHTVWQNSVAMNALLNLTLTLCGLLLQFAIMRLALDYFAGSHASLGACAGQALRSFLPLMAMGLIAGLPVALGLLLLVVPGIMLLAAWSVAAPIRIAEGAGIMACLKRSMTLTRGHRWKITAIFLITGAAFVPVALVMLLLWGLPLSAYRDFLASNYIARLMLSTLTALVLAALYVELRAAEAEAKPT